MTKRFLARNAAQRALPIPKITRGACGQGRTERRRDVRPGDLVFFSATFLMRARGCRIAARARAFSRRVARSSPDGREKSREERKARWNRLIMRIDYRRKSATTRPIRREPIFLPAAPPRRSNLDRDTVTPSSARSLAQIRRRSCASEQPELQEACVIGIYEAHIGRDKRPWTGETAHGHGRETRWSASRFRIPASGSARS